MGAEVLVPLAIAALSTGATVYNQRRTERKQDTQLADSIRRQSGKQKQADAKVADEVKRLEGSTAQDARRQRLADYMASLQRGKVQRDAGLTPTIGSAAFQQGAAQAREGAGQYAGQTADLMSQIDAAGMQRQSEGFGFGKLATDLNLIGREAKSDAWIDGLRLRMIRKNPWIDAAAGIGMGVAGGMMGGGWGSGGGDIATSARMTPVQYGGKAVYGPGPGWGKV